MKITESIKPNFGKLLFNNNLFTKYQGYRITILIQITKQNKLWHVFRECGLSASMACTYHPITTSSRDKNSQPSTTEFWASNKTTPLKKGLRRIDD